MALAVIDDLVVVLNERVAGAIVHESGKPRFAYVDAYASSGLTPLSLSMPLREGQTYRPKVVGPWLAGLLPDNERVRELWAKEYGVSSSNPSALLRHVGRDCAGAVQIAPLGEVDDILARTGSTEALSELEIGSRLRELHTEPGRWIHADERWSLAGAQAKFTAVRTDAGWARANGNAATTHIIKPGITGFRGQALNEHLCLSALAQVGVPTALTEYHEFDGVPAIVVTRYDRVFKNNKVIRVHQEDMCQALGVWPDNKYADHGGPAAVDIARLLAESATQDDVDRFANAVVAQYLLGAPDGHAKNYSVVLAGNAVTLAPIYDVASIFPYPSGRDANEKPPRVAMPINGRSRFGGVSIRDIAKFATAVGTDPDKLVERTRFMATALPDAIAAVAARLPADALGDLADLIRRGIAAQSSKLDPGSSLQTSVAPPVEENPDKSMPLRSSAGRAEIRVVSHTRGGRVVRGHSRPRP
ncbi:type II toxin-antitoxin system HipA family toxin [Mycobacterium malmoense]|uniref:type II toxin-antitoxin system HipA family toxin n=1 Tax=Mycobacterium malmoense TaxID=1780 RepID=UPI0009FA93A3|nr:type II toxin-antitoxin system HipA family toxin [Mycobacterium malmoense]